MVHKPSADNSPMASVGKRVPRARPPSVQLRPHPDSPNQEDLQSVQSWLSRRPKPWAIDLFCGAGGLSLGLEQAGFSIVAAADTDRSALSTHRANFPTLTWLGDLSSPNAFLDALGNWGIREIDLLAGGPPCQPFSNAGIPKIASLVQSGDREAQDSRRDLWRSYFSLVDELGPRAVLLENVPDMARSQEGAVLVQFLQEMESRGYRTAVRVLESWRYGVPQHRKRLFIVGIKDNGGFEWPAPHEARATLRDAIGDLPQVPPGQLENTIEYLGRPTSSLGRSLRDGLQGDDVKVLWDHVTRFVRDDDAEAFSLMAEGQTYQDLPDRLRRYRGDIFSDKYVRLRWDGLSRSITAHLAKDGYWYIHPRENRTLSVREAARIQTFPDSFRFAGSMTSRFAQIGNAVPPLLGQAVGRSVLAALNEPSDTRDLRSDSSSFRSELIAWHLNNKRDYPWRRRTEPWSTFLAETCLHRTKADQVAAVFENLLEIAPTASALLRNEERFRKASSSLGLAWRTDSLVDAAGTLVNEHSGTPPDDWSALNSLPGVGDYVASAILCFAYGHHAVLIDTNTLRVAKRILGDPSLPKWKARVELYRRSAPLGPDAEWNYALLDLGGTVCTARRPVCDRCPVSDMCATGQEKMRLRPPSDDDML